MNFCIKKKRARLPFRILSLCVALVFIFSAVIPPTPIFAQTISPTPAHLPLPGTMIAMSPGFTPVLIKGMTIHADNPLQFDFIVNPGDTKLEGEALREEGTKLIKYFLASLTVPEKELWVNLSPYEKNRIIPDGLGETEMGRDMLAQDYLLKQLTASLIYPEDELGSQFWKKVYQKAHQKYGTTEIPVNTFNKVWIVPDKAAVYEHNHSVFVVERHLKVMLEEDYLAMTSEMSKNKEGASILNLPTHSMDQGLSTMDYPEIIRDVLIPEIEKEVNEGKTFAPLRQIYNSMILATWYKQNLKESLLGKVYMDRNKVKGADVEDKEVTQKIYNQYIEAFKKGVYNYIKEDYDPASQTLIPRKYFSGGIIAGVDRVLENRKKLTRAGRSRLSQGPEDFAMLATLVEENIGKEQKEKILAQAGVGSTYGSKNDGVPQDQTDLAMMATAKDAFVGSWQNLIAEALETLGEKETGEDINEIREAVEELKALIGRIRAEVPEGQWDDSLYLAEDYLKKEEVALNLREEKDAFIGSWRDLIGEALTTLGDKENGGNVGEIRGAVEEAQALIGRVKAEVPRGQWDDTLYSAEQLVEISARRMEEEDASEKK